MFRWFIYQFFRIVSSQVSKKIDKCNHCGNNHGVDALVSLYDKTNNEKKQIIKNEIINCLEQKFSFEIFYQATLFEIIEFDNKNPDYYIDNIHLSSNGRREFTKKLLAFQFFSKDKN